LVKIGLATRFACLLMPAAATVILTSAVVPSGAAHRHRQIEL